MTIDESGTFLNWVSKPIYEIIFNIPAHGNNHILNTLLMKGSVALFGTSEFAVRLPNFLAFIFYLFFSIKISQLFKASPFLSLLVFVALNFQPYKIDFFGFGRGYGLALAFMLGSLYALFRWVETDQKKYSALAFGLAILSVYSNFVWLNYFVALVAGFLLLLIIKRETSSTFHQNFTSKLMVPFLAAIVLLALIYIPIRDLQSSGDLQIANHWGNRGFWLDTYFSLFESDLYGMRYLGNNTAEIIMGLISVIYFLGSIYIFKKILSGKKSTGLLMALLLLVIPMIMGLSTVVQHTLFGTGFLERRTALVFTPFLGLFLPVLLSILPGKQTWNNRILYLPITVLLIVHSLKTFKTDHVSQWHQDKTTKEMVLYVNEQAPDGKKSKLGVYWSFASAADFYVATGRAPKLDRITWDSKLRKDTFYDYYYIYKKDSLVINPVYQPEKSYGKYQLYKK